MKSRFPVVAAIGLVILWGAMLFAVHSMKDLFTDFKVEMPVLTITVFWVFRLSGGVALPMLVLAIAFLLGLRQFLGWVYALVLCVAWTVAFVGLLLPIIALINNLSGGDGAPLPVVSPFASTPMAWLILAALVLNQVLFVCLVFKRREFAR